MTRELPAPLLAFLTADDYDHSDDPQVVSVSELVSPSCISALARRHRQEAAAATPPEDNYYRARGNAVHAALAEKAGVLSKELLDGNIHVERRLSAPIPGTSYTLTGQPDLVTAISWRNPNDGSLPAPSRVDIDDWKVTSVTTIKRNDWENYERQLEAYAWLVRQDWAGPNVPIRCESWVMMDDWKKTQRHAKGYPPSPIAERRWIADTDRAEAWIRERLADLEQQLARPDHELRPCSMDERWGGRRCEFYCEYKAWCPLFTGRDGA
jgi:hypothetical protein